MQHPPNTSTNRGYLHNIKHQHGFQGNDLGRYVATASEKGVSVTDASAAAADRKLLLGIIKNHNINVDFDTMATYMNCTASAIRNRYGKLKVAAKEVETEKYDPFVVGRL